MTLQKAIKILTLSSTDPQLYRGDVESEAQKLGIEALEAYQKSQANGWYPPGYKLPGETLE